MDINLKQLEIESGVKINRIFIKGDKIIFDNGKLSKEDELKVREALKTHVPKVNTAEEKLIKIQDILNS